MMKYQRGDKLAKGKTKNVVKIVGDPDKIILENRDDITAFNDPEATKNFPGKGVYCTTVNCRIFEILKQAGVPTAYLEQISPTEFVTEKVDQILLEVVSRRIAIGSYVGRKPWLKQNPPLRFHRLVTEFFLKTTDGKLTIDNIDYVVDLTKEEDDPFIANPHEELWKLFHPKVPFCNPGADLIRTVDSSLVLKGKTIAEMDLILRKVTLILEGLFQQFGLRFADLKIEFGITKDGRLVVTDVIDPDSWRILTWDWIGFSKQAFRDGEDLNEVERKYGMLAGIASHFRIPRQALIIWCGSDKDAFDLPKEMPGLDVIRINKSGHKETDSSLKKLEELLRDYPDGGVIITKVGRSNGLGPVLSTHSQWQTITVPADWKDKPQNVWSHLDMPSDAPLTTCLYDNAAVQAAFNILGQKNPIIYMERQLAIENLDSGY